ncbi:MAG: hypothetical protein GW827_10110, partial [Flavobacteriales bacterium]|nr:hypothetical protein [Flavobacteriales bacterium]
KLKFLEDKWKDVNFSLIPYRTTGTCTLGGWGDIYNALDEDVLEVQQLEVSQFKGPFIDIISDWSSSLLTITNVLENWKRLQQKWMQLQPIFE